MERWTYTSAEAPKRRLGVTGSDRYVCLSARFVLRPNGARVFRDFPVPLDVYKWNS